MKKITYIVLVAVLATMSLIAEQTPIYQKFKERVKSAKAYSYNYEETIISDGVDTITLKQKVYLQKAPADTFARVYYNITTYAPYDAVRIYDGKHCYVYSSSMYGEKVAQKIDRKHQDFIYNVRTYSLSHSLEAIANDTSIIGDFLTPLPDTTINGILCEQFLVYSTPTYQILIAFNKQTSDLVLYCEDVIERQFRSFKFFNFQEEKNIAQYISPKILPKGISFKKDPSYIEIPPLEKGEALPEFTVKDLSGQDFHSSQLKGKNSLVIITQIGCPGCEMAIPELIKLHESSPDLEIAAIYTANGAKNILQQREEKGIKYNAYTSNRQLMKTLKTESFPTFYFVDKDGKVFKNYIGYFKDLLTTFEKTFMEMQKSKKQ